MKKRIAIIAVIAIVSICLVSSFMGCKTVVTTEDGLNDLNQSMAFTKSLQEYSLKIIEVTPDADPLKTKTKETNTNVHLDNEKTKGITDPIAKIVIKDKDVYGKGPAYVYTWGYSLKEGVKAKKAVDADWKKQTIWASTPENQNTQTLVGENKSLDEFLENVPKGYSLIDTMNKLDAFLTTEIGKNPSRIYNEGRVTIFEYDDITEASVKYFGKVAVTTDKDKVGAGKYPLRIEIVHSAADGKGYVSSISDKEENGMLRVFITMKGPVINVPNWK